MAAGSKRIKKGNLPVPMLDRLNANESARVLTTLLREHPDLGIRAEQLAHAVVADTDIEAISEGETGISVPEGDEKAVAQAVITLLKDENLKKNMGAAARVRALREQTWEIRVKEYSDLLHHLLEPITDKNICI